VICDAEPPVIDWSTIYHKTDEMKRSKLSGAQYKKSKRQCEHAAEKGAASMRPSRALLALMRLQQELLSELSNHLNRVMLTRQNLSTLKVRVSTAQMSRTFWLQ